MERIDSIIKRVLKNSGKGFLFYEGIVKNRWKDIVGDFIAVNSAPDRISNNVLYIRCFNSALKQELFFLKKKIIKNVNSALSNELIEDIKLFYNNR
jgi:predicted nucleic acid-binding Zn ribbon protein